MGNNQHNMMMNSIISAVAAAVVAVAACPSPNCIPLDMMAVDECGEGVAYRKVASDETSEGCRTCPTVECVPTFDCRTRELWSEDKKDFCCKTQNLGCDPVADCPSPKCIPLDTMAVDKCGEGVAYRKVASDETSEGCRTCPTVECVPTFDCRTRELWSE